MILGTPSLSFTDVSSLELAEEIAVRLERPSGSVIEVIQLRLHAMDVAHTLASRDLLADQRSWEAARLLADGANVDPEDIDRVLLDVLATKDLDADALLDLERLLGATSTSAVRIFGAGQVVERDEPLTRLARGYLDAALARRRDESLALVSGAVASGSHPDDVMLTILKPAQRELGQMWERGEISVAHEHYVTELTQTALAVLYPFRHAGVSPDAPKMVAVTVGSEGHELGMRMVSELMRAEGWNVAYLGADVPARDVVRFVSVACPQVLAISVTMSANVLGVRDLISELRAERACTGVHVMVGGRPFLLNPRLQALVDADGWAPGPHEALQLCWLWAQRSVPRQTAPNHS